MSSRAFSAALLLAAALFHHGAHAADGTAIEPMCNAPYTYDMSGKACVPTAAFEQLSGDGCTDQKGKVVAGQCVAPAADERPKPHCGDVRFKFSDGKCYLDDSTPRSATGDYVGDCFTIRAVNSAIRGVDLAPLPGKDYRVVLVAGQKDISDGKDRELKVVDADLYGGILWCLAKTGADVKTLKASELIDSGASRRGWVFGVMMVPFKYYKDGGSRTGNLSVGPYAGWRYERNGSGFTLAASAALSSIQGETRDSAGNITDRPELVGYTAAVGVLWDLWKRPGASPFQLGIVAGQDRVARSAVNSFKQDGKTWYAVQIGYRFTDN